MKNEASDEFDRDPSVNLFVDAERSAVLKEIAFNLPDVILKKRQLCDLELLATGAFSPLEGFMIRADYESVLDRMRLQNDILWPVPICLDVSDTQAQTLEAGQSVALRDEEGFLLAVLHIEDIWAVEREKEASQLYGTVDRNHPGVRYLFENGSDYYLGGKLEVTSLPLHSDFKQLRLAPKEIKATFRRLGWQRIVGFQTRNPIYRPQLEIVIAAMRQAKANLLLLPIAGMTKPGDFDHYTRARCYRAVTQRLPPDSFMINLLPLATRMAGPREAILHSILAKNYGCTHFIVGRDHASPGSNSRGEPFYESDAAGKLTEKFCEELDLNIVCFDEMVYLPFEDEYRSMDKVPDGTQAISLSGSDIRERIRTGRRIPEWATFPEVTAELLKVTAAVAPPLARPRLAGSGLQEIKRHRSVAL